MLRICGNPPRPEAGLTFEKDFISPALGPDYLPISNAVDDNLTPSLYCPSTVSLPPQDGGSFETPEMFHWLSADKRDTGVADEMASKKASPHGNDIMGEDHEYWSEPFMSYEYPDDTKTQLYGLRSHSAPQSHESLVSQPQLQTQTKEKIDIMTGPLAPNILAQRVPKPPGLYMLNHALAPLANCKSEPASITPLLTPGVPQHDDHPSLEDPSVTTTTLYQRSAEESSVATADSDFTSIGSSRGPATPPLPWSSFGVQAPWNLSCQTSSNVTTAISHTDPIPTWLAAPQGGPGLGPTMYNAPGGGLSPFPAGTDTVHGPPDPAVDNNTRYMTPAAAASMDLYRDGYPAADKDPGMEKPGGGGMFHIPGEGVPYCESAYRFSPCGVPHAHAGMEREMIPMGKTGWQRDTKNAFLIECKRRGLSYKDIKRIGGFKEAESTLRGRFRTLTKSKEQRVRKPQWHEKDVRLLCEAVEVCSEAGKLAADEAYAAWCRPRTAAQPPKVSWKKVAQYIWTHGGSYHFGNATCKRKWCEVQNVKV
ncbi:hypothetical protein BDV59DRAFT_206305 [Aspergillus ambiguus]|uniref:uncharacterized protein n=1 Tax=Aspergillus ambiguus TaxID=176160 RepID=UPI003CCD937B